MHTYIILFQCADREGIVARVADFIYKHKGNIVDADQYSTNPLGGDFFMRVEFITNDPSLSKEKLGEDFGPIAREYGAQVSIYDKDNILRMPIFVSKADYCLLNLLYLWKAGDLRVKIPFVAGNYEGHRQLVEQYNIPFHFIPADRRERREDEFLALLKDSDFLVLARYMLVFSKEFLRSYAKDIINIHHGLLPSFKGGNPYKQALEKGVKVIGATAHFVTEELDSGPIITQEVERIRHKDDFKSLLRKGRHLESRALSEAVSDYIDYRIIRHNSRTIVF